MNQFEKLLTELEAETETMAKALKAPEGDEKIAAAAGEEAAAAADERASDDTDTTAGGEAEGEGETEEAEAGAPMAKSFKAVVDGVEVDAIDGTELVKSLTARIEANENGLAKVVKAQGALIKSLVDEVKTLKAKPAGRKATVTVLEKPSPLAKSESAKVTPGELLAKCSAAHDAGKLTGMDLSRANAAVALRQPIPQDVLVKALA